MPCRRAPLAVVEKSEAKDYVNDVLKPNADGCYCGRYSFYSADCGHINFERKVHCGTTTSASGNTVTCVRPLPIINVRRPKIAGLCDNCA
jgi:hypothetical protein